jgi:pullulanase/glycogen debranching enzyme
VRLVADIFQARGRAPLESVNYVTSHDGFTLRDLVSYDLRHNEANRRGQPRRPWPQPELELRLGRSDRRSGCARCAARLQRALLATVLLGQGTPMLAAGERNGPQPARQQQRLLPGQRDLLAGLVAGRP